MTEAQATLHQLQSGPSEDSSSALLDSQYVQTVELNVANPFRKWLRLSTLLAFIVGFLMHQYYLGLALSPGDGEHNIAQVPLVATVPVNQIFDAPLNEGVPSPTQVPDVALPKLKADEKQPLVQQVELEKNNITEARVKQERELVELKLKQLDLLYSNAASALSKDRLLTPESDNAVYYFQAMLDIDDNEPRALAGLQSVVKRYKKFAISLAKKGDIAGAANMLERAESVVPQLMSLGDLIAEMPAVNSPESVHEDQVDGRNLPVDTKRLESDTSIVRRSINGKADDAKFLAKKYLAAGQARDAAALLSGFMPQSATDGEFVELLHQAYLNSNQNAEALKLRVALQGALAGHHIAKMQAAEFMQSGQPVDAIAVLEKNLPSYEQDSAYYGLLAGLYYRVQRYADAEQAYEKLLAVAPQVGSYWLGYAVALDAQSNKNALGAFRKASLTLPAQDAARQYVEQRVRELSGG